MSRFLSSEEGVEREKNSGPIAIDVVISVPHRSAWDGTIAQCPRYGSPAVGPPPASEAVSVDHQSMPLCQAGGIFSYRSWTSAFNAACLRAVARPGKS